MSYKRNRRKNNKLFTLIEDNILKNKKAYSICTIVFIAGIIVGIIMINSSNAETQKSISGYITEFIETIKNREFQIDGKKLLIKSLISNLKIAGIIWIAGSSIIGIPLVYASLGYKGMCMGYSISAIIATLNNPKGIIFALSTMLLQNIIAIPCLLALSVSSLKMYKAIMKNQNKSNIKFEIYRHSIFSIIMTLGLVASSFVEVFISTNITSNIIINFI